MTLQRNEFKDALDLFECSLKSHRQKYGDIHHLVGTGLHNSGIVLMLAEHYAEAKTCFQEAVSIRTAALGGTHPDVAVSSCCTLISVLQMRHFVVAIF